MKFSCPSCQAKYQIADEKLTGPVMKMKCRKCGAMISVQAQGSFAGGASVAPQRPLSAAAHPPSGMARTLSTKPLSPSAPKRNEVNRSATPAPAPTTSRASVSTGGASAATLRQPTDLVAAPPALERMASRIPAALPEWYAGVGGQPLGPMTREELRAHLKQGQVDQDTLVWREGMSGWIALGEVPDLADLLRSLQVRTAPPVAPAPVIARAVASPPAPAVAPRVSAAPAPRSRPVAAPTPVSRPAVAPVSRAAIAPPASSVAPTPTPAPVSRPSAPTQSAPAPSAPVASAPVTQPGATGNTASSTQAVEQLAVALNPSILPAPQPEKESAPQATAVAPVAPTTTPVAPEAGSAAVSSPVAVASLAPESSVAAVAAPVSSPADPEFPWAQPKQSNRKAIAFAVLAAVGFGLAMGFVIFGGEKVRIIKQVVEVPGTAQAAQIPDVPAPPAQEEQAAEEQQEEDSKNTKVATGKGTTGTPSPSGASTSTPTTDSGSGLKGLTGLQGLTGSGGPVGGPSSGSTGSAGGQPLESSQIQSTVAQYQASVRRSCWQPALDSRDRSAPSSARVTVTITVAGSGSVQQVSSSGDPTGYSGLARCIEQRVRGWQFPRSSGTTTVNVPFVFAAQ